MKRLQITYKTVKVKYRASHQQWFSSLSFFSPLILSFWDIALFRKCKIGRGLTAPPSKVLGARPYCFLFSFFVLSSPNNGKRASGAMALSSDVNKRQFWSNKNGPACCHRAEQTSMSANPPPPRCPLSVCPEATVLLQASLQVRCLDYSIWWYYFLSNPYPVSV